VDSKGYNGAPDVVQTDVPFATLTLSASDLFGDDDASITWTDAAATLTAEGAAAFAGFYTAGTALDPGTFTLPATDTAPEAPVISVGSTTVAQGGVLTVSGSGLPAGSGVFAEIHSTVVTLATKTVASDGTVSFAWTVPADFEAGTHTIYVIPAGG